MGITIDVGAEAGTGAGYAELHCLSNFSFLRGASHPFELVKRAKELGYEALALTDECSLAGIVRAHEVAKAAGLKLIVGSEFALPQGGKLVLLVPDHAAYTQLCELITRARRRSEKGRYALEPADFETGLNRCLGLWMPAQRIDEEQAAWFARLPLAGRWIAYAQMLAQDSEERLAILQVLGSKLGLGLVATGDVRYHVRERRRLHDTVSAVRLKTTVRELGRAGLPNGERHLRPLATLQRLYPPELLAATLEIAQRCTFSMDGLRYEYPHELVPEGLDKTQHLRALTEAGIRWRWPQGIPERERGLIEKELSLIEELKYEYFFLTVADIVRWARDQGILCQGRGSAANSVVCYALGITEVDPKRVSLLFERFISQERGEPPDIDVDFEHHRREEVMQYVYRKYGRRRAALAATVICYRRKLAVRDVGRALGLAPELIDVLSKSLHWFDGKAALPEQLHELGFQNDSPLARQLLELVGQLVGFPRHLSQHVGGFVISEHSLSTLVPVENAAMPERTIIQWDKEDLESLKLLKVDCLALGMLSAIKHTLQMLGHRDGCPPAMQHIPPENPETYDMLCKADAIGVFQVESRAQMSMLPRLKPKTYYDLVIEVAIVRPGPIQGGMVHPYLRRRQKKETVDYPKEELRKVLERTHGVPLFQEQVMQIAVVAAGFSPGKADLVRRSMAAWQRKGGLDHFRDDLINGMLAKDYSPEFAERIFQQILGFGDYGFPESHAASFALLAYVSAWLKCHEPAAFCAGLLNAQPMGFYSAAQLVEDARRHGVVFLPADVQASAWDCTLEPGAEKTVRLGLRMIGGLAEEQGKAIAKERGAGYRDLDDLALRAALPQRILKLLARAGALRELAGHRRTAYWSALGVERLPPLLAGHSAKEQTPALPAPSESQEILADYRSLGLSLGRHPLALLRPRLSRLRVRSAAELAGLPGGGRVRVAGLVTHRQRPGTASGVMFVSLEDETGIANLVVWPRTQEEQRRPLLGASLMIVQGELQNEQGVINVVAHKIRDCTPWLGELAVGSRDFR